MIWRGANCHVFGRIHGLTSSQYQTEFDQTLAKGYLTRGVTGYEENGAAHFAAYWSK